MTHKNVECSCFIIGLTQVCRRRWEKKTLKKQIEGFQSSGLDHKHLHRN